MSSLFTPYKLGPVTLRNRTVRSAAFESMGRHFGPTEQLKEYHVSVARGGVGMTTLAYAAVSRSGLSFDKQLWLRPEIVPGLRGITDAVGQRGQPYIYVGGALFMAGMAVNLHSDHIIRNLRKPGDTRHYIPRGGMFRYVSSANYFGELLEWTGFAVASWSWAGAVFAWWTFANLAPRAASLYKRYAQEFGKEFTALKRKKIIPFIY